MIFEYPILISLCWTFDPQELDPIDPGVNISEIIIYNGIYHNVSCQIKLIFIPGFYQE
jgi:hypothetical protein